MNQTAEQVIVSIQNLPLPEQWRVLDWLNQHRPTLAVAEKASTAEKLERQVLERLLAKGLLSEITTPMTDTEDDECEPLAIDGEPLSDMILRERR